MSSDIPDHLTVDAEVTPGAPVPLPVDALDEFGAQYSASEWVNPEGFRHRFAPPPEPAEERHVAAALAPGHWLGMVDPAWRGDGPPPAWALIGRWRSGPTGEVEEWQDNSEYRASPEALGWPAATDPVDAAVQLASTGYGPSEDVTEALVVAEVAVLVSPDGIPLTATALDGTPVLPVYTSLTHVHAAGRLVYQWVAVTDLIERLPEGHLLYANPTGPVSMLIETEPLLAALATLHEASTAQPAKSHEDALAGAPDESPEPMAQTPQSEAAHAPEADHPHTIPGMERGGQARG
ncbi:type VII secretion system-associated protein [Streptomyces mirabilis]